MIERESLRTIAAQILRGTIVGLVAVCVFSGAIAAPQFTVFKTVDGAMIAWNESTAHFTIELPGKTFKHVPMEGVAFIVDGRFVQVVTADISAFTTTDKPSAAILESHRAWETENYAKQFGEPASSHVKSQMSAPAATALLWDIEWPAAAATRLKATTTRTLFATQVVGDRVVTVSMPLTKSDEPESTWAVLQRVMASLTPSSQALDFKATQERVRSQGGSH